MSARALRAARGLTAAAVALFTAALSHVASGGGAPGGAGLALAAAFSAIVCVILAGRRLSVAALSISVLISQFAFHLLFGVGAPGVAGLLPAGGGHHGAATSMPGMAMGATDASGALAALAPAAAHPAHDSLLMWAGHAVAAVVTIALLHRGESVARSLAALAARRFRALARPPFTEPAAPHLLTCADGLPVLDRLRELGVLLGALHHRGPPAAALAHP